ncbi:hypothetical protein C2I18_18150 [Paenibacillus sp. PK3_47]|uniref:anti-sigma factor n=1 Tax=Paenibacillus sp. PK3_47 TaxID=2072642 RepID=UPI00201D9F5C|nr:anti-sigma factor [Paenibacillus sp. PK3_47]UQZ35272.1 hypothetical protein C2I18_18150 [Paenibacillus sp. PK3_47]
MSEEFKEKLRKYGQGSLPEDEREEVEQELEKLEAYQLYLDELVEQEDQQTSQRIAEKPALMEKKEKRIIRRGKWKARFSNTMTVLSAFLALTVISSIITAVYYSTGDRGSRYGEVLSSAIAVSRPNTIVHLNSDAKIFFKNEYSGRLLKQVGSEEVDAGSYSTELLFGLGGVGHYNWTDERTSMQQYFFYPQDGQSPGVDDSQEWKRLDKLPEGTVAEAFLSLDRLYGTDELLKKLEPLNLLPVWFAVDDGEHTNEFTVTSPLGFPYRTIWLAEEMTVQQVSTEKTGWFSSVTSKSSISPSVEEYGSGKVREENFLRKLRLMQEYKMISSNAAPFIKVDQSLDYVEEHGIQLYGAVITGPVKELLKLKETPWISNIRIGEVRLWNWRG